MEILFLIEFSIFALMFNFALKRGIQQQITFLFVISVFFVWFFISPLYGYMYNIKSLFRLYLWDYYPYVIGEYIITLLSFFLGYILFLRNKKKLKSFSFQPLNYNISLAFLRISLLVGVFSFVLWGISSGRSLSNIFLLGLVGLQDSSIAHIIEDKGNVYLLSMIGILTPILTLAMYSKMKRLEFYFWVFLAIVIYVSQGFRYRILLLMLSFLFLYIVVNGISLKRLFKIMSIFIVAMVLLMSVAEYRGFVRTSVSGGVVKSFEKKHQPEYNIWFTSARSYLPFAALIKYLEEDDIPYGYGETMFGHIFIRAIPSVFFENGVKPKPPALEVSASSWHDSEGYYAGEAYSFVGGTYYEFGTIGIILFSLLFGYFTGWINRRLASSKTLTEVVLYISITVSFFQLITRGYLPGYVIALTFLMLPFVALKFRKSFKGNL